MMSFIFVLCLLYHTYTDMKSMLLYDKVTLLLATVGAVRAFYEHQLLDALYGAGVTLAIMLLLYFASRGGMGEGDVKLAPALGIWLGLEQGLLCLLLAFVSGGVVGALLLLCRCGKLKQAIPFGPFLCAAAVAAYFWGIEIIAWYWRMIL
ncbi:A24 family peptidase [uncultured Phascolarctobacterium sp.]|uniref:prepilin peptidase n=1 Tax=uncultured Phascolarctobacterium sp. TaxID=512296 RepID=UPI0025F543F7|nr:A24 family peptidase [uncultured Phascolarctobacterium sp.]